MTLPGAFFSCAVAPGSQPLLAGVTPDAASFGHGKRASRRRRKCCLLQGGVPPCAAEKRSGGGWKRLQKRTFSDMLGLSHYLSILLFSEDTVMPGLPGFPAGASAKGAAASAAVHVRAARVFYEPIIPVVVDLRRQGLSLRAIAHELDIRGVRMRLPRQGQRWSAQQVRRVLDRARAAELSPAAAELLERCRAHGVRLIVEDGNLMWQSTTDEDGEPPIDLLRACIPHREELTRAIVTVPD